MDQQMPGSERVATVVGDLMKAVNETLERHEVTYDEYRAAKQWLIDLGEAGEWPLYLDVFHEFTVEVTNARSRTGSDSTIEGPYYLPDMPQKGSRDTIPMRADEAGEPFLFVADVRDVDGTPLAGAEVDMWHADADGYYSGFDSPAPVPNLRARFTADENGHVEVRTILPAPYSIPVDGPTGQLCRAAGWSPMRPAHLHFIVRAPGQAPLTTQLYFTGDTYLDGDVASAVKPGLVLGPTRHESGEHGIDSDHARVHYEFRLDSAPVPAGV